MRLVLSGMIFAGLLAAAPACESLGGLKLEHVTVAAARVMPAANDVPAYCRVSGTIRPSADSDIKFEVWMPEANWNGRFQAVGNGGFAGSLSIGAMAEPVRRGYATATTDTGHSGPDAKWAPGHPEKLLDYGHRAIHEMTVTAKAVIAAYYGKGPSHSYFASCSNGGRQALMEAQRYPDDYDGLVAGAPANDFTHIITGFAWNQKALLDDPASRILPAKLAALEEAALTACDASDGAKDGLIENPTRCKFDPAKLLCQGAESDACLTAPQLAALKKIYEGPRTSKDAPIFPGFVFGGEGGQGGWAAWINSASAEKSLQYFFALEFFRNMVFDDPAWEIKRFDFDRDVKAAEDKVGRVVDATDPDLRPFLKRGGKLILYHGWCDAALTPVNTIRYYERVVAKVGSKAAQEGVRLYMLPGVQHCSGGPGPDQIWGRGGTPSDATHDVTKALEAWVEQKSAPAALIASKISDGKVVRTRPLCPWPAAARYRGSGSVDDAANFACK